MNEASHDYLEVLYEQLTERAVEAWVVGAYSVAERLMRAACVVVDRFDAPREDRQP